MAKVVFSCVLLLFLCGQPFFASDFVALNQEKPTDQLPRKFDEFGDINCEDELARLDAFAVELQNQPNLVGYIIIYGGRSGKRNEAKARAARMSYYLVHSRGLKRHRIITLDGGFRETLMGELFLSQSAQPPKATPTLAVSDVKLKGRARVYGYNCGDAMGRR
jgi:hypothetical protein